MSEDSKARATFRRGSLKVHLGDGGRGRCVFALIKGITMECIVFGKEDVSKMGFERD